MDITLVKRQKVERNSVLVLSDDRSIDGYLSVIKNGTTIIFNIDICLDLVRK